MQPQFDRFPERLLISVSVKHRLAAKLSFPPSIRSLNRGLTIATNCGDPFCLWPYFSSNDGVSHASLNFNNLLFDLHCWLGVLLGNFSEDQRASLEDVRGLLSDSYGIKESLRRTAFEDV